MFLSNCNKVLDFFELYSVLSYFDTWRMLHFFHFIYFIYLGHSQSWWMSVFLLQMFNCGILCQKYGHWHLRVNTVVTQQQQCPEICVIFSLTQKTNSRLKLRFLRLKHLCWSSDGGQTLVCAFLTSLFKREATASHHLLNSPIRYKATITHEGWVCVLLAVLSTFVS